jgi:hypothetical protein
VLDDGSASKAACKSLSSKTVGRPERGLSSKSKLPSLKRLNHLPAAVLPIVFSPSILLIASAASLIVNPFFQ